MIRKIAEIVLPIFLAIAIFLAFVWLSAYRMSSYHTDNADPYGSTTPVDSSLVDTVQTLQPLCSFIWDGDTFTVNTDSIPDMR